MRLFTRVSLVSQLLLGTVLALGPVKPRASPPGRSDGPFWLEDIKHQGIAAFNNDTTYEVFRNVKDYGAKGLLYPQGPDDSYANQECGQEME